MSDVTIVICSHDSEKNLNSMIKQMKSQTLKPNLLALCSGYSEPLDLDIECRMVPNYNDFGHAKRSMGLMMADTKYVGFANDDDKYEPTYVETLYNKIESDQSDIVACDWYERQMTGALTVRPELTGITAGCFLVRTDFAQGVGYNHREYDADGLFIQDMMDAGAKFSRVDTPLYRHL